MTKPKAVVRAVGAPLRDPGLGKRRTLSVRVRPDLDEALRAYAGQRGLSLAAAIDHAIEALTQRTRRRCHG